jgi:hypothetical protein
VRVAPPARRARRWKNAGGRPVTPRKRSGSDVE